MIPAKKAATLTFPNYLEDNYWSWPAETFGSERHRYANA